MKLTEDKINCELPEYIQGLATKKSASKQHRAKPLVRSNQYDMENKVRSAVISI